MGSASDIVYLTATELAESYRAGTLSPLEATAAFLDRIDAFDGSINAFCFVDADRAIDQAKQAERRFASGRVLSLLDGIPTAVKDVLLTEGWPTLRGSRLTSPDQEWLEDAPSVERLRARGAVLIGKTATPELGWKAVTDSPLTGVTRNPWDTDLSPGGSSGGSAAAVAAGMVPLALGTDGGGSIRIPAALSGVAGIKPTYGRVPQWPASPFAAVSHVGPMAWTVADAALMLTAIAGPDLRDPTTFIAPGVDGDRISRADLRGLRIAFSPALGYVEVEPEVAKIVVTAVKVLEALGAEVSELDPGFADPVDAFQVIWYSGAARALERYDLTQRADMDAGLVEIAEIGARCTASDYLAAMEVRSQLIRQMDQFLVSQDLLVTPTLPILAIGAGQEVPTGWPARRWMSWTPFTYPFNLSGNPAASVPCGFSAEGLPVGLQIVGPRYGDEIVIASAAAYQQMAALMGRRPVLPAVRRRRERGDDIDHVRGALTAQRGHTALDAPVGEKR